MSVRFVMTTHTREDGFVWHDFTASPYPGTVTQACNLVARRWRDNGIEFTRDGNTLCRAIGPLDQHRAREERHVFADAPDLETALSGGESAPVPVIDGQQVMTL